jgi:hypothetical protein
METKIVTRNKTIGRSTSLPVATATGGTTPPTAAPGTKFIKWFADIGIDDIPLVGGKNASLGEMYRELALLRAHAAWHRPYSDHRRRDDCVDAGARIQIGETTQRRPEPQELPGPQRFRASTNMRAVGVHKTP